MEIQQKHIMIQEFIGHFPLEAIPNAIAGRGSYNNIYPPEFYHNRRDGPHVFRESGTYYKIDHINGKMTLLQYWQRPQKTVSDHIHRLSYKVMDKIGKVKRVIPKIEAEQFQLRGIVIIAEKQLNYLKHVFKQLRSANAQKNGKFIVTVTEKFTEYHAYYQILSNYYMSLAVTKRKYEQLLLAIQGKNACFQCFKADGRALIKRKNMIFCTACVSEKNGGDSEL